MEKIIAILAARTQEDLETKGADVEEIHFQTIGEAKQRARYLLTEEYQRITESSYQLGYAQIRVNGHVSRDYFRKGA